MASDIFAHILVVTKTAPDSRSSTTPPTPNSQTHPHATEATSTPLSAGTSVSLLRSLPSTIPSPSSPFLLFDPTVKSLPSVVTA